MVAQLCECGCGLMTRDDPRRDTKFVHGHNSRVANNQFKGDEVGYDAVHDWVVRRKPRTGTCERCGESRYTELANISGEYRRDVDDYIELCKPCHIKFDRRES